MNFKVAFLVLLVVALAVLPSYASTPELTLVHGILFNHPAYFASPYSSANFTFLQNMTSLARAIWVWADNWTVHEIMFRNEGKWVWLAGYFENLGSPLLFVHWTDDVSEAFSRRFLIVGFEFSEAGSWCYGCVTTYSTTTVVRTLTTTVTTGPKTDAVLVIIVLGAGVVFFIERLVDKKRRLA